MKQLILDLRGEILNNTERTKDELHDYVESLFSENTITETELKYLRVFINRI